LAGAIRSQKKNKMAKANQTEKNPTKKKKKKKK
jgi:hypothetical protein